MFDSFLRLVSVKNLRPCLSHFRTPTHGSLSLMTNCVLIPCEGHGVTVLYEHNQKKSTKWAFVSALLLIAIYDDNFPFHYLPIQIILSLSTGIECPFFRLSLELHCVHTEVLEIMGQCNNKKVLKLTRAVSEIWRSHVGAKSYPRSSCSSRLWRCYWCLRKWQKRKISGFLRQLQMVRMGGSILFLYGRAVHRFDRVTWWCCYNCHDHELLLLAFVEVRAGDDDDYCLAC